MTLTEEIIQMVFMVPEERKVAALWVLRGEAVVSEGPPRAEMKAPLLMGIGAGAKYLGVSRVTLWRMARAGKIERVELVPGRFRVRRADLERLAEGSDGGGKWAVGPC